MSTSRGISLTTSNSTADFTLLPIVLWTRSEMGDAAFDSPSYVKRMHVTATTALRCESFTVQISGEYLIDVFLGTCIRANAPAYDGIVSSPGGQLRGLIVQSTDVNWTFTEVR